MKARRRKVLLIGTDTAGYLTGLANGFEHHGYRTSRIGSQNPFDYSNSKPGAEFANDRKRKMINFLSSNPSLYRTSLSFFVRFVNPAVKATKLRHIFRVLWVLPRDFDIVVYNHGHSLTGRSWEYAYLRKAGLKLIFVFHGTDVRPAYLNGAIWSHGNVSMATLKRIVSNQVQLVTKAEKFAHMIVCWAGITHFFTKPIHMHEVLGFPLANWAELNEVASQQLPSSDLTKPLRVLHSPSNPKAKGTGNITQKITELQCAGLDISFECVSGVPHRTVMHELQQTDFVIDQLYSDSAAGVFAAEASMLGKPAIVGSSDVEWLKGLLKSDIPPTCFIRSDDLGEEITRLASDLEYRKDAGKRAQNHFNSLCDPEKVVSRYFEALYSDGSRSSIADPLELVSARGGFAPHDDICDVVQRYVTKFGKPSLALFHNPELEESVISAYFMKRVR